MLKTALAVLIVAALLFGHAHGAPTADELREFVTELTAPSMEGRGVGGEGIDLAAVAIVARFTEAGLTPAGDDGGWFQTFDPKRLKLEGAVIPATGPVWRKMKLRNIAGIIPGTGDGCVILAAHYDHLGRNDEGELFPGADDNASGVAVLWSVASELVEEGPRDRDILFLATSGEEEGRLGSRFYVEHPVRPLDTTIAMLNLDTVGRIVDRKLYVFASTSAKEFPGMLKGVNLGFDFDLVVPEKGPFASDQVSFLEKGVPSLHLFTGPNADYHRPSDTAEKLDYEGLAEIAAFTAEATRFLADRDRPLTFVAPDAAKAKPPASPHGSSARRVSFGTIPDFGDQEDGVLISGVLPGSPAEQAGLQAGDRLVAFDGEGMTTLEDYTILLKSRKPGDQVRVTYIRDGEEITVEAVLVERK